MYNQFLATRSKARLQKDDAASTAGAAKISTVTARSKSELKELGEKMGWTPGLRTMQEINAMGSQEMLWHEQFNKVNLEKAFAQPAVDKYNTEVRANQESKRMWEEGATGEQHQKAIAAADKFTGLYPQFIRSDVKNQWAIVNYMADHNLDATRWESYATAFVALVPLGKIALNPSAIGAGSETEMYDVSKHRNYHLLLQAQRRPSDIDRMSADEFKTAAQNTHPELKDQRVPKIVAARNAKAEATAQHFQQAAEHTNKGNVVALTDYPENEPSGYQTHSKFRFKQYVKTLSASEFQEKLDDPTFVAALDRSADGNKQ